MRKGLPIRFWAAGLLLCSAISGPVMLRGVAQAGQSATAQLLEKARTLDVRGRTDMAKQTWQQVLLVDPNNAEALAGMAKAARLEGKNDEAAVYLNRLRAINPNDPNIGRVENLASAKSNSLQLQQAGKLAQAGQYAQAMTILRQVYGDTPPAGDAAISFYQTEAATQEGRPHAIAGLRALAEKYPSDSRYQIELGTILTYDPRTRAEGRRLLQRHPESPEATEALRQSLVWDAQNPATAAEIRNYLARHQDQQLSTALAQTQAAARRTGGGRILTPEEAAALRARTVEDQAAYGALNAHQLDEADTRFKYILSKNPNDAQALAGMGYVRMQQSNFGGAISYLEQAQQGGIHDAGLEKALKDARFFYTMQEATTALNENNLVRAQSGFESAQRMRPDSPDPLLGLGGTLLKGQKSEAAIGVFENYVKQRPNDKAGWSGLLMAESGANHYNEALALDKRVPAAMRTQLLRDPDYLRTLASVYTALGRDADAQRVLQSALDLPFPADARGVQADTQMQYAGLLAAAKRNEQAAGLYRQVLAADSTNTAAWTGLITTEHAMGQDANALQALGNMPASNYQAAMQDSGFETLVASVYQSQGKMDEAEQVLDTFLTAQRAQGKPIAMAAELQLASIYMTRGDSARAYPLYRETLKANPENVEAWNGLLSTLHSTGHDQEALAQVQQMSPALRKILEQDATYLQTVGSIYAGLGHPQEAMAFLNRVQQRYAAQRTAAPADVDIQNAWLLYNSANDAGLYRALMGLGSRTDLTDEQRRTVQTIWASWAVRRSTQAAQTGNDKRALAILNAAAKSFPDNPAVTKALASGYATAGLPKQAVSIFKAQDLSSGPAADYKAAVGAALANNDLKDAETWLRFGLQQYPRDPQLLVLAAKFEQARGDPNRAAEYYKASLAAMPREDFGAELSGEMTRPAPTVARRPAAKPQDLATLLSAPEKTAPAVTEEQAPQPVYTRPYLPGSANTSIAPVPLNGNDVYAPPAGAGAPVYEPVPAYPGTPDIGGKPAPAKNSTLKDYVPQSKVEGAPGLDTAIHLHPVAAVENVYGPYTSYDPSIETPLMARAEAARSHAGGGLHTVAFQQSTTADGTTIVPYADVAKPVHKQTPAEAAKARAAAIRKNQDSAPQSLTGVSHPPTEDYNAVQLDGAQFSTAPANAAQQQGAQVQRPQSQQAAGTSNSAPSQTGDSYGQQYPQPNTRGAQPAPSRTIRRAAPAPVAQQPTPEPSQPSAPMAYPVYPQPLANPGLPPTGQVYPLPPPPSDQDLIQQNVPPLRGYYDPRPDPQAPLTERQQAELDLATIEGSYSGWLGGTANGRYRSGTPGIDRLTAVEVPFEFSGVASRTVRFSIVPKGVFLNSGVLDTTSGALGTQPVLGTLPGNALNPPQQQFASGVGGEIQMTTNTLALAAGYTPYGFLISNAIGRARWKPGNGHFTLYGGRDAVKETMLSYAGLRDPGSARVNGNIWGGVVETGGGVRFDFGDEKSGFYVQAEGADLTGYHVLHNRKYDGTMGAYFRVKNWPDVGSLNVGGTMFGEHYNQNERGETYGLGGYFSPNAYFLAAVPVTFSGHHGVYFHYLISGSAGIQTFQEDSQKYFPLDLPIQTGFATDCGQAVCAIYPVNSNTGLNYSIDAQGSYQVTNHWYIGGFLSGNNTNNYNTVSGGFFARYLFRPQYPTADYPTGLFPIEGFRPIRVP